MKEERPYQNACPSGPGGRSKVKGKQIGKRHDQQRQKQGNHGEDTVHCRRAQLLRVGKGLDQPGSVSQVRKGAVLPAVEHKYQVKKGEEYSQRQGDDSVGTGPAQGSGQAEKDAQPQGKEQRTQAAQPSWGKA